MAAVGAGESTGRPPGCDVDALAALVTLLAERLDSSHI